MVYGLQEHRRVISREPTKIAKELKNLIYYEKLRRHSLVSLKVMGDLITFWDNMCGKHEDHIKPARSQCSPQEGL